MHVYSICLAFPLSPRLPILTCATRHDPRRLCGAILPPLLPLITNEAYPAPYCALKHTLRSMIFSYLPRYLIVLQSTSESAAEHSLSFSHHHHHCTLITLELWCSHPLRSRLLMISTPPCIPTSRSLGAGHRPWLSDPWIRPSTIPEMRFFRAKAAQVVRQTTFSTR